MTQDIKASVIIPTKNPGPIFHQVLTAVLNQQTEWPYEVLVIDSGSTDGTLSYCRKYSQVGIYTIPPESFQHGKTRNEAIALSKGQYAVLLTHDAIPTNEHWLSELVQICEQEDDIAGVFGRHYAHPDANPITHHQLDVHFDRFAKIGAISRIEDKERYDTDESYRQFLHFFSDNNACVKRSVWEHIPYPEVDFAEDQLWAKAILETGYAKGYSDKAAVYHSHEFGFFETFQRSFDEARAFNIHFGYHLCRRWYHLFLSPIKLTIHDLAFLKKKGLLWSQLLLALSRPFINTAKIWGHFLGQYHAKLPDSIVIFCSRDKQLQGQSTPKTKQKWRPPYIVTRLLEKWKLLGTIGLCKHVSQILFRGTPTRQLVKHYQFLDDAHFGNPPEDSYEDKTITWFIPEFEAGSGGHLNIFRFIYHLESQGYDNHINIISNQFSSTVDELKKRINTFFFPLKASISIGRDHVRASKYGIATSWHTAYSLRAFSGAEHKCYFVQDFEPYFYPHGSDYLLAEDTYRFGFYGITAGHWLAKHLSDQYQMICSDVGFSYDRDLYQYKETLPSPKKRVFFYARPVTHRRGFELGILALYHLTKHMPDVEIVLAGWDVSGYEIPFNYEHKGKLDPSKLPELYNSCDIALVLSFTNLSLLPLELMACGCVVVSNRGPNAEWLLNDDNAILADATIEGLGNTMLECLKDDDQRQSISEKARAFAQTTNWRKEAEIFADILESLNHD